MLRCVLLCFSAIFHPFVSLHSHMHMASELGSSRAESFVCFIQLFIPHKEKRICGAGPGNCLVYAPPDVADNPLMSFGLLHCISFACRRPPIELHISIDSLELRADIIFPFGAVCLSWLGKLFTHPELGRANSRFNCKFPRIGHH